MTLSRRALPLALPALFVLPLLMCAALFLLTSADARAQSASPSPAATAAATPKPPTVRVTLLQVNDVYQISPVDKGKSGGLARVAEIRRRVMQESPHALFLLGGDTIAPSVASNIFKGRQMIAVWNATGLDASVLGNHEFDFGPEVLLERMKESRFAWLGANVIDRRTGKPFGDTPPFLVVERGGVKIGVFGLLTPETENSSKPGPGVQFRDPCETAKAIIPQMKARGAQAVVAVTHLTMPEDKALALCAPGIDVILGGHEHSLLQSLSGRTPIFKVGSDARNVGRIDLHVSPATNSVESIDWEIIPVTNETPDEPRTAEVVAVFEKQLSVELDKPVGVSAVELDARQETNRTRETNLGSYITDAYKAWARADVSIINSGSIRSNTTFGPGTLTKRDLLSVLPFENHVVKIEATGAQLRAALEHGVGRIAESPEEGRFPQIAGMRFTYDARLPTGKRVTEITVGGQPLDDKKTYTVASNAYLVGGGDGYAMFKDARFVLKPEEGPVEAGVLIDAVAAAKEIKPQTDGRIKRLDGPK